MAGDAEHAGERIERRRRSGRRAVGLGQEHIEEPAAEQTSITPSDHLSQRQHRARQRQIENDRLGAPSAHADPDEIGDQRADNAKPID